MFTELLSLCILVNTNTDHHTFCDFSGHVERVHIQVYENGWAEDKKKSFSINLGLADDLEPTRNYLTSLLKDTT